MIIRQRSLEDTPWSSAGVIGGGAQTHLECKALPAVCL